MNRQMSRTSHWDEIRALACFFDNFASTDAVSSYIKKKSKGKVGSYLLRPSNRNRDLLTASVLVPDNSVRHTHIQIEENGTGCQFFLVVEKKFSSIHDLINFYSRNPVKNLENVSNVYFQWPLTRQGTSTLPFRSESHVNGIHRSPSVSSVSSRGSTQNSGFSGPPPLPVRPSDGSASAGSASSLTSLDRRPPLPLPTNAQNTPESNLYYSQARDVSEDISERLKEVLKTSERCECGIPRILAELPLGWTVHLSKDPQTAGRLFYQNNDGVTSWTLPEHVRMQLTKTHKQNLSTIEQKFAVNKFVKKNSFSEVHNV